MIEPKVIVGQPFRARLVFRDVEEELVDSDPLIVKVLRPDGVLLEYEYGVDEIVRDSEGVYHFWVSTAGGPSGDWTVAGVGGSGDNVIFAESVIYVHPSRFDTP